LLLALFSFSLATPVVLAQAEGEARLPSCCRRDGKHGCSMMKSLGSVNGPALQSGAARCAMYPGCDAAPMAGAATGAAPVYEAHMFAPGAGDAIPAAAAGYRFDFGRSSPKRGPPSFLR